MEESWVSLVLGDPPRPIPPRFSQINDFMFGLPTQPKFLEVDMEPENGSLAPFPFTKSATSLQGSPSPFSEQGNTPAPFPTNLYERPH